MLPIVGLLAAASLHSQSYVFQFSDDCGNRTIHGLWPEWASWCGGTYDPSKIESVQNQLTVYWPSCVGDDNASTFHAHEWLKHGTCSDYDEAEYFATALRLYQLFKDIPGSRVCLSRGALTPFSCD